jgi:hypothetical protein
MSSKATIIEKTESRANSTQHGAGGASIQELFDTQKTYFATDVTKTYEWRIECRMPQRKSCGEQWRGVGSGALHRAMRPFMSPWQKRS